MIKVIHGITLECIRGNIVKQPDCDAIVNAANAQLRTGGGVAGAIHRAAGPELEKECRSMTPIQPGEAVISGAHNLPNKHVIHCLGPVYGQDKPEDELLAACYKNSLDLAEKNQLTSIAFPAISTGAFGYPAVEATRIALQTVSERIQLLQSLKLIRFVLFGEKDLKIYIQTLVKL